MVMDRQKGQNQFRVQKVLKGRQTESSPESGRGQNQEDYQKENSKRRKWEKHAG